MDVDLSSANQEMNDELHGQNRYHADLLNEREIEFYSNYSEIFCSTVSHSGDKKSIQGKELIQQKPEDSKINPYSSKLTKVFDLNPQTLLIVTIQGKVVETTVKFLSHTVGFREHEVDDFSRSNSWVQKQPTVTKRFNDHSYELLQEVVLQRLDEGNNVTDCPRFCLFYCSKDLSLIYGLRFTVSEYEFRAEHLKMGVNAEFQNVTTFAVSYSYASDRNVFLFGSEEVEGVLISNQTSFGRKQESNERLNLNHVTGLSGILKAKIGSLFNTVKRRITNRDRTQHYCLKLQ
jgi:hypothetical protein